MGDSAAQWWLRPAGVEDLDDLHAVAALPAVFRYLFDGEAPSRDHIGQRIAQAMACAPGSGGGMWLLENTSRPMCGCAQLVPDASACTAELTYLLHPDCWGQGLALRLAWTVIAQAFQSSPIEAVIAGADEPNAASFAVMQRLGMRFHRHVRYPLGPGREYILRRADAGPRPAPLPLGARGAHVCVSTREG